MVIYPRCESKTVMQHLSLIPKQSSTLATAGICSSLCQLRYGRPLHSGEAVSRCVSENPLNLYSHNRGAGVKGT